MSQNYTWPAQSVTATNPSVAPNGQSPSATSSTLVAGQTPGGAQEPLQLDGSNSLFVAVTSSALPSGGATSANQTLEITQLTGIHSDTTSLDGKTVHVDTGAVVVASSALPTGASTSALQTSGNSSLTSINANQTNGTQITQVSVLPSIPAGANNIGSITNITGTVSLPTGASTSALQTSGNASLTSINANQTNGTQTSIVTQATAANLNATVVGSGNFTVVQPTGTNLHTVVDSSALPTGAATSAAQTDGTQKSQIATPTALTVTQAAIAVGTTAVRLTVSGSSPSASRVLLVAAPDPATTTAQFYIGSSSVTSTGATRGPSISVGQTFIANNDAGDYWIISDTAAQTVNVMEQQ